jgi:hypothetical protein
MIFAKTETLVLIRVHNKIPRKAYKGSVRQQDRWGMYKGI